MSSLNVLESLSQYKYRLQSDHRPERCEPDKYIDELNKEVQEVKDEIKNDNAIYLQDELGDILWDFLGLIQTLKGKGMIDSLEDVIYMAEKKYKQRVEVCLDQGGRDRIKEQQKKELLQLHNQRYKGS